MCKVYLCSQHQRQLIMQDDLSVFPVKSMHIPEHVETQTIVVQ